MSSAITGSDLLKETYPLYQSAGYTLEWIDNHTLEIVWNYGRSKRSQYSIEKLLNYLSPELPVAKALDIFVYSMHPLDALEASRYGSLGFSSRVEKWIVFSIRPDGSISKNFLDSFSAKDQGRIMKVWAKTFSPSSFQVTPQNLIIEVASSKDDINATHCLSSEKALQKVLHNSYDLSDDTYVLIDDNPKGSILIGHKDAVERLAEIPGSNYSLKTYQEIQDELWRKNV
jgi:hypothetical protein